MVRSLYSRGNERVIMNDKFGRKQSWQILKYYTRIFLRELRRRQKTLVWVTDLET
jgi:hypothetical protein